MEARESQKGWEKNGASFFPACLDFPLPPLSALPWVSEDESNDEKIRKQNEIDAKEFPLMTCILF